jgi:hypothetical protein
MEKCGEVHGEEVNDLNVSLMEDHKCKSEKLKLPSKEICCIQHQDQVWFVSFSNNSLFISSASKDGKIIISQLFPNSSKVCFFFFFFSIDVSTLLFVCRLKK